MAGMYDVIHARVSPSQSIIVDGPKRDAAPGCCNLLAVVWTGTASRLTCRHKARPSVPPRRSVCLTNSGLAREQAVVISSCQQKFHLRGYGVKRAVRQYIQFTGWIYVGVSAWERHSTWTKVMGCMSKFVLEFRKHSISPLTSRALWLHTDFTLVVLSIRQSAGLCDILSYKKYYVFPFMSSVVPCDTYTIANNTNGGKNNNNGNAKAI